MRHRWRVRHPFAMRLRLGALLALLLPCAAAWPVEPPATLKLIDIDPGVGAILHQREPLYLRLRYRSATTIHILLSGY